MSELTNASLIATSLAEVKATVARSVVQANRDPDSVQLLAVSKRKPLAAIAAAWKAGQRAFGENYPDEAVEKIKAWQAVHPDRDAQWHYIGAIQSRKAAVIATHFDWVHSVDRLKVAKKLALHRPERRPPLSVCIQVNLDNEVNKSGVAYTEAGELADAITQLPQLQLRGLMSIPAPRENLAEQRAVFRRLSDLLEQLKADHPQVDTLSMGMSADLEAAISEGATIVRVGTAIFGSRDS